MAEFSDLKCEPCHKKNITKSASILCMDCQIGYCKECCSDHKALEISKNHTVKPVKEYLKTKTFNVNLDCPEHSKQFDFYCPTHDDVVCVLCLELKHGGCKNILPLDEAAKDAKISTAFKDLDQTIDELLDQIEKGVQQLQQNKTNMGEQEEVIKKSVAKNRAEINKHLDLLEEKLLKELKSKSEKAMTEMSLVTTKFETKLKTMSYLKDTTQNIKLLSSNLQGFVVMKTVVNEMNGIKLLLSSISQISVAFTINPKFAKFNEDFDSLGELQITSHEQIVRNVERTLIQAEHPHSAEPPVHKLDNLQLKLRKNIKMGQNASGVSGCVILPNKCIMITSNSTSFLTIPNEDGYDWNISVPYNTYDVTIIDDQMVAVSHGWKNTCISIVNINYTENTKRTIENVCKREIRGISYSDGKLYAVADGEGIKVISIDGDIIKTICIHDDARRTDKVTVQKGKIYYSVRNGSVYCIDMDGTEIWTCHDGRLKSKYGSPAMAVDNYGITFAAGNKKHLLLAISPDGKQQKVLLTNSDGLLFPTALYFDKDSQRLLVCNFIYGQAALYDVIYYQSKIQNVQTTVDM